MKKNLFITIVFLLYLNLLGFTQCTLDPIYTAVGIPGIFPTPTEGIASGTVGTAYSQNFTVIVPADTTIVPYDYFPIPGVPTTPMGLTINSITIGSITGLPTGLSCTCLISSCIIPGGNNSCFIIDGSPSQSGTFTFSVPVVVNVDVPILGSSDLPAYDVDYILTIDSGTVQSIKRIETDNIEVYAVLPNPSSGGAEILFSTPNNRDVSLTIHNMIGALVKSKQFYSEKGINSVSLDTEELDPGVYIVTIMDGVNSFTERMVIGAQ